MKPSKKIAALVLALFSFQNLSFAADPTTTPTTGATQPVVSFQSSPAPSSAPTTGTTTTTTTTTQFMEQGALTTPMPAPSSNPNQLPSDIKPPVLSTVMSQISNVPARYKAVNIALDWAFTPVSHADGQTYAGSCVVSAKASDAGDTFSGSMNLTISATYNLKTGSWEVKGVSGTINEDIKIDDPKAAPSIGSNSQSTGYKRTDHFEYQMIGKPDSEFKLMKWDHSLTASVITTHRNATGVVDTKSTLDTDQKWTVSAGDNGKMDQSYSQVGSGPTPSDPDILRKGLTANREEIWYYDPVTHQMSPTRDSSDSQPITRTIDVTQVNGYKNTTSTDKTLQEDGVLHTTAESLSRADFQDSPANYERRSTHIANYTYARVPNTKPLTAAGVVPVLYAVYNNTAVVSGFSYMQNIKYDYKIQNTVYKGSVVPLSLTGKQTNLAGTVLLDSISLKFGEVTRWSGTAYVKTWEIKSANTGLSSWTMGSNLQPIPITFRSIINAILDRLKASASRNFASAPMPYLSF